MQNTVFNNDDLKIIDHYKNRIQKGENIFYEMIDKLNLELATSELAYISHWITPKIEKRRYSTRFFIARTTTQEAVHDGTEGVESKWINPKVALEESKIGKFSMIMPTIKNLEMISEYSNSAQLLTDMNDKSKESIPKVEPIFEIVNGEPKLISY